ncbi:MAG TPA: ADP compounds hydrolase NudE [Gammaproteobacteria bacterium]|jgi:ADP-ribose diphosphatase|nr:ADP compounds hydrolase NudE [Gammaproteobacteria bacterium]HAY41606.1 ADP compounds hydrolase NudE [Gammaproteobacteria bacterium]|tara:strand:+ start:182 stop:724 length:543 start_codon:yes stop_codon:yes gene_type:complete
MRKKPTILKIETIARTRLFNIESIDLKFSNGVERQYERLRPPSSGAVLVIPMLDNDTVLMIYEYSGGTDRYELALPKGKIDDGETHIEAANRELMEEVGYGANKITFLKTMTLAPGYQSSTTHIMLAEDLYVASADGDEPEPLEIVKHKLSNLDNLVYNDDLTESRSIAALYMAKEILNN